MNKFNIDVFINGKMTFEVFADTREEAMQMVDEVMNNSSISELKLKDNSNIDIEMKEKIKKDLER